MTPPTIVETLPKTAKKAPPTFEVEVEMDPRIRDRRFEVKREKDRKRVRTALTVLGAFVAIGFGYLLIQSSALDVDHVRVVGATNADTEAILEAVGDVRGDPLLRVDTNAMEARIEEIPWVADANVVRKYPGTLRVSVTEHGAVAYVRRASGAAALLAADGRVVADVEMPPPGIVEILGLRRPPRVDGVVSPPGAPGVLTQLPPELADRVVAIDLRGDGVTLDLDTGGEVRLGSLDDLEAKAAAAIALLEQQGTTPFEYIDVSVPPAPAVK